MWPFVTRSTIPEAKAERAGKGFWETTGKHATAILNMVHKADYEKRNWDVLLPAYAEVVAFALHITSRMSNQFGQEKSAEFMDALFPVVERLAPTELKGRLQPVFNRREPEYGACKKIFADKDEPLRGTLM